MKGEVRNPTVTWLICAICGIYGVFIVYTAANELKNYLGKDEINPMIEAIIALLCAPFALFRLGPYIQEAQQRAGMAQAQDQGAAFALWWFLCGLGFRNVQEELNRVWESGGGAPATF